jgi:hypothetical protein
VIVWLRPGRSSLVRRPLTTKSWIVSPRLWTTKRTVDPAGTERRESLNVKSLASTRMLTGAWFLAGAEPARDAAIDADTPAATSHAVK